ncbi:hypothetical protein [Marinobacter sp. F3R08]|uniref:hypothetical protein n=1 Tax=Marinobacter sp. F3R08 TaxID=2841559 RepID=UPI001E2B1856|nr:hypothetical protein [Marinobacter sp. F3R08]
MSLTALCIQSFPFALLKYPVLGICSGVQKSRKSRQKNKNNADRQRFEGGFVRTDPPFDFLGHETVIYGKHVQIPLKPLNSRFLLIATTDFNA